MSAPLLDTPWDCWHEIFTRGMRNAPVRIRGCRDEAPWIYLRVCRAWATVAKEDPSLWSNISLEVPNASEDCQIFVQMFHDVLTWSSSNALSLHIINTASNPEPAVWSLLRAALGRCVSLEVVTYPSGLVGADLPSWQLLTSLDIDLLWSPSPHHGSTIHLGHLAALKRYTERSSRYTGITIILPLLSLEYVALHMRNRAVHGRLGYAPNVTELRVHNKSHLPLSPRHPTVLEASFPNAHDVSLINADSWLSLCSRAPLQRFCVDVARSNERHLTKPIYMALLTEIVAASRDRLETLDVRGRIRWQDPAFRHEVANSTRLHTLHMRVPLYAGLMHSDQRLSHLLWVMWDEFLSWIAYLENPCYCTALRKLAVHCEPTGQRLTQYMVQELLHHGTLLRLLMRMLRKVDEDRDGAQSEINVHVHVGDPAVQESWRWVNEGRGRLWRRYDVVEPS